MDLAAMVARSGDNQPVAVVTVVPHQRATPSMARVAIGIGADAAGRFEQATGNHHHYCARPTHS